MSGSRIAALVFSLTALISGPSWAGQPVWDPAEIAELAEKSAQMAVAVSRAAELLARVDDLSRTIGRFGALSSLDFARFKLVDALQGAGPEIGGLAANISGLGKVKITSVDDISTLVKKVTTLPAGDHQTTKAAEVLKALDDLHRKAVEDGFALAMQSRQTVSDAPARAALLVNQASTAHDLRSDTGANTAASLAVLEQLMSLKVMLASMVEMDATKKLKSAAPAATAQQ